MGDMLVFIGSSATTGTGTHGGVVELSAELADESGPAMAAEADELDTHAVVMRYQRMVYGIALTHTGCRGTPTTPSRTSSSPTTAANRVSAARSTARPG